ncbi:20947_t:CDS:2 [Cetraspora pellucida]|uniref:20947_t:CDS:1 n=1 Tax=Cetraspora pellucida TaxID=1433469 RepID=A0A9N9CMM9_9GLOM|nr:20947_t:CDS:2 [Cetraspora pellucida]
MAADMKIQKLSVNLKEHPDIVYRYSSKFINTHEISQQLNIGIGDYKLYIDLMVSRRLKRRKTSQGSYCDVLM